MRHPAHAGLNSVIIRADVRARRAHGHHAMLEMVRYQLPVYRVGNDEADQ